MAIEQKKIMIVDDDVDYVLQLTMILEHAGYLVKSAHTRKDGVELFPIFFPDLAIIDLMMEQMDAGFMLAYELKKLKAELPVIMITSVTAETGMYFEESSRSTNHWMKADAMLSKPVRPEQLLKEVERLMK